MDMSNKILLSSNDGEVVDANRSRARSSIFLSGKVTLEGVQGSIDVRVRNLSATGAMLECKAPVHCGQALILETKGIGQVSGKIAWAVDKRIGVAFDKIIDPDKAKNTGRPGGMFEVEPPGHVKVVPQPSPGFRRF